MTQKRAAPAAAEPFSVRARAFFHAKKRDVFFAVIAAMALGMVVRRELMANGVIAYPKQEQQTKVHIERPKRNKD